MAQEQMLATDPRLWYVVRTKPKQENRADFNLRAWGVETFAPKLKWPLPRKGFTRQYEVRPLFPGYLFARFDAESFVAKVRLTRGVHDVVGFGEYATPVEEAIVSLIRNRLHEDGYARLVEPKPGDKVEIIDGPLQSLTGIFDRRLQNSDRVLVLLSIIGSGARLQLPGASIRCAIQT